MVDLFRLNTLELQSLVQYKEVLEENKKFPKGFWSQESNMDGIKPVCKILTRYCLENIARIEPYDLPKYNLKQIKSILVRYKLFGMIQAVFKHDILSVIKNAYPEQFNKRELKEWMWSKHGIWQDDKAVIEAVQDMIYKEGIRRVEDIPLLDWKKRLLKHGIYNVLSRFNWSIFKLFDFVYPGRFHPADFKYKAKWVASESLDNAYYCIKKAFRKNKYNKNDILMLGTADFRKLGLAGMLISLFDSSTLKAKEYYFYKTIGDKNNQDEIKKEILSIIAKKKDEQIKKRLEQAAVGKYIYNLHKNATLYSYIKRHAKLRNMSIDEFVTSYGFVYKSARKDVPEISKDDVWRLRKQGLTYVEIARELDSNPTTITAICNKYFGGDPLIPRPIEDYVMVQELMDKYHIDHKTIMKLVHQNGFENHTTIRFRYLKKSEIVPAIKKYIKESKQHQSMIKRYASQREA